MELRESWYEKLRRWDEALGAYRRRLAEEPASTDATEGCLRCLSALGEWEELGALAGQHWPAADEPWRRRNAPLAASAAWYLGRFDQMGEYAQAMDPRSVDGALMRAVLQVRRAALRPHRPGWS